MFMRVQRCITVVVTQALVHCQVCSTVPKGVQRPRANADISGSG